MNTPYKKTTDAFKRVIENHLQEFSQQNYLFKARLEHPDKNIDDCISFILNHVHKSNVIGYTDEEIYALARHYYDEDNVDPGTPLTNLEIKINHMIEPNEQEIKNLKQKALDQLWEQEKSKLRTNKSLTQSKANKSKDQQKTLF